MSICRKNVAEIVHCPTGFAYDVGSNKCLKAESIKWYLCQCFTLSIKIIVFLSTAHGGNRCSIHN